MSELTISNITKKFGAVTACNNISFSIVKNDFFFFLGPSGCGKTTLLKIIAGLIQQDSGSVYLKEKCLDNLPPYQRDVNTVFQNYALFPHMNIFDNIAFGLKMKGLGHREITAKVTEILDLVELQGYEKRKPNQLSGGQQQRVALARALVNRPSVLLLDEPLGALDVKLRKQMQIELKHLQKKLGITFICVTHDQDEALTMADQIAVMNHGQFEQVGSPDEIYSRPTSRFVAEFIGDSNFFEGSEALITSDSAVLKIKENGLIKANAQRPMNSQDKIIFSVRPEKIFLHKGPISSDSEQNQITGVIDEIIYMGNSLSYLIKSMTGQVVKVLEQNYHNQSKFKVGDRVFMVWSVENTVLLEK